ncbi:hypothetical protein FQR65_LT01626 [Abscondita terminalis]|nr:hypothetical protein FQR65_LT01626 [Abscondita terminalis]
MTMTMTTSPVTSPQGLMYPSIFSRKLLEFLFISYFIMVVLKSGQLQTINHTNKKSTECPRRTLPTKNEREHGRPKPTIADHDRLSPNIADHENRRTSSRGSTNSDRHCRRRPDPDPRSTTEVHEHTKFKS